MLGVATLVLSAMPVSALSEERSGAISQHCASIKQSLKALQRTDARTRSYLGISYESFLKDFISPLNLRLINANQPSASLTDIHSSLISTRKEFTKKYTTYAQSLEDLISYDCQGDPETFYQKLETTREHRSNLGHTVADIRALLERHRTAVSVLIKGEKDD